MKTISIVIENKKPYTGNAEKHPFGDFYADGNKYTCWDETYFNTFNIGDSVLIIYTEKPNDFGGQHYINRNISKMSIVESDDTEEEIKESNFWKDEYNTYPPADIRAGTIVVDNKTYEVILRRTNGN